MVRVVLRLWDVQTLPFRIGRRHSFALFWPRGKVAGRKGRRELTQLGDVILDVPRGPKDCRCCSRGRAVVCMKGTGGLGEEMSSCFRGRMSECGAGILISGVFSVSCAIIGARRSTLLLRGDLVGGCGPECGILLGSNGACPSVYIAGRCFPHVFGAHRVGGGIKAFFNPCPRINDVCTILRIVGGLCGPHAYEFPVAGRNITRNGCGPYLRCRVRGYNTPYVGGRDCRRCRRGVHRTHRVLGKGAQRMDGCLCSLVVGGTRLLHFRVTRRCGGGCRLLSRFRTGDRIMDRAVASISIFAVIGSSTGGGTFVGCVRIGGNAVGRDFACRCGHGLRRDSRRLLVATVPRVERHFRSASGRVVIPFRVR